ncbi:glycine oxidase ThiO [Gordonia spumicola]|uniref:Glycine oxidase ThiO n=1 Tax=Gordonia spumicola TaxID=589161 RepID=A0A7I9V4B9_9ACTN|nr:FAD-dependent oxidoreductase [Gordonia spumicola]GEE00268.1 glycine oxidase ThiO [Gordonia spumicola]
MGPTLSVVGAGAIGLSCALAAADRGWAVTILDAGTDRRAAHVAGGMLGCFGEGRPGEGDLLDVSVTSAARWPAFLERLGRPDVRTADDTLLVGASSTDLAEIDDQVSFVRARSADAAIAPRSGPALRSSEPMLARGCAGGYLVSGEGAVDNRRLLAALRSALVGAGAAFVDADVEDLDDVPGDRVLVAAGLHTPRLVPGVEVRGEKGEILRLRRTRWSVAPPSRVIRARWHGRPVYVVPREDGVVVGATQYEAVGSDDRAPQAGGVADLLADVGELLPGLRTYELSEVSAGIRPSSVDGLPMVRRVDDRVLVATGHGRNGIALSPWTADRVVELLA